MYCLAPTCISNTSKWKQSVPDCIPLSSCLIDSSNVVTRSDWPGDCTLSPCDWPVNVRAGGNCRRGATLPGPGTQGRFKAAINIHGDMTDRVHTLITRCFSTFLSLTHSPLRLMRRASCLECDSLLARMNMTTWSCVCSEMSRPLMRTTRSPSRSLGSHRPAYKQQGSFKQICQPISNKISQNRNAKLDHSSTRDY